MTWYWTNPKLHHYITWLLRHSNLKTKGHHDLLYKSDPNSNVIVMILFFIIRHGSLAIWWRNDWWFGVKLNRMTSCHVFKWIFVVLHFDNIFWFHGVVPWATIITLATFDLSDQRLFCTVDPLAIQFQLRISFTLATDHGNYIN